MPPRPKLTQPLWCKQFSDQLVYHSHFQRDINGFISFRSFDLEKDLDMIHNWNNLDYARTFWQMRGSVGLLRSCYQCILQNPFAHSFIGLLNQEPVCQFDIYQVSADELANHVQFEPADCGFHLIMAPLDNPVHGLTISIIQHFLWYYFSADQTGAMFAEPDAANGKSIALLEKSGFTRIKTIEMSYKTAHVYQLTNQSFLCRE